MYQFRFRFAGVHTIADAMYIMGGPRWGPIGREITGAIFLLCWILATGTGLIGMSTGLGILTDGRICAVVFSAVAAVACFLVASIRTLGKLSWLTWAGFFSIFIAVFIVVYVHLIESIIDLFQRRSDSKRQTSCRSTGRTLRHDDRGCRQPLICPWSDCRSQPPRLLRFDAHFSAGGSGDASPQGFQ